MQQALFDEGQVNASNALNPALPEGLVYQPAFLSAQEQADLLAFIEHQPWLDDLKRRVQHYGYKYDYRARAIDQNYHLGPLPLLLADIGQRLYRQHLLDAIPDQAIINEYMPGQGITRHIDCEPCFTDYIASVSLCAPILMELTPVDNKSIQAPVWLEPGSVIVLADEARYHWMHGIAFRKSDVYQGVRRMRARRISVTFRKVILSG